MSNVNNPKHYGGSDSIYEAIKVIEAWGLDFCLGNAVKYISRSGKKKTAKEVEDLQKAIWYLERRIQQLTKTSNSCPGCNLPTPLHEGWCTEVPNTPTGETTGGLILEERSGSVSTPRSPPHTTAGPAPKRLDSPLEKLEGCPCLLCQPLPRLDALTSGRKD